MEQKGSVTIRNHWQYHESPAEKNEYPGQTVHFYESRLSKSLEGAKPEITNSQPYRSQNQYRQRRNLLMTEHRLADTDQKGQKRENRCD
jgi:hypothetical protein